MIVSGRVLMPSFLPPVAIPHSQPQQQLPTHTHTHDERVRMEVLRLLDRASYNLTCERSASAFKNAVQPAAWFTLALEVLLPVLESRRSAELAQRILVSYILHSLYEPHPIKMNPFKSVLFNTFTVERSKAVSAAKEGRASSSEQFVWVLWKILKGDGNDIGFFTPGTLARNPIAPGLRPSDLVLDEEAYINVDRDDSLDLYNNGSASDISSDSPNSTLSNVSSYVEVTRSEVEQIEMNEHVAQAMRLLLQARGRVLRLSEQRMVIPYIPDIASSHLITSVDLTPIAASNPAIAHPLFVELLKNASGDNNHLSRFMDVLPFLPPCLPTFDLIGRLLGDATRINIPGYSTVADWVRMQLLGSFIHECIEWIERANKEQMQTGYSNGSVSKALQDFARFFTSLIKRGIVDPTSDADVTEVLNFALRYSLYKEATDLYSFIVTGQ